MSGEVLSAIARAPGAHLAVVDDHRSLSYAALDEAVRAEARWLQDHAVERCGMLADNGVGWVVADLALLRAGVLNVPLPAWFTPAQIAHAVRDACVESLLTDEPERMPEGFRPVATAPRSRLTLFRRPCDVAPSPTPSQAIKVTYTSGSTGAAKGVCLTRQALERVARSVARSVALATPPGVTRHLCTMPLSTLLENVAGVYAPLMLGARSIIPSARATGVGEGDVRAERFLDTISRHSPHSLILAPEMLRLMIEATRCGWTPPAELRFVAVGGATVAPAMLEHAHALGIPAYEGYGLSECASVVCLNTPAAFRPGSVGKPLPHARVRLDEHGQILVGGAVMSGYLGEPASSDQEIATGDLGHIDDDGYVYVRGRMKNMFITSMGRNVSPEWVESALLRDGRIRQAVVFGEARPYAVALVHPASASAGSVPVEQAIAAANADLPQYARIRRWALLPVPLRSGDALLTANGRPRRAAIAERYGALIDALYADVLAS